MNEKYANIEKLRAQLTSIDEKKKQEFETLEPK